MPRFPSEKIFSENTSIPRLVYSFSRLRSNAKEKKERLIKHPTLHFTNFVIELDATAKNIHFFINLKHPAPFKQLFKDMPNVIA